MKISDELRELAGEAGIYSNACGKLRELADRIDRETVELPRAADDEVIHAGDTLYTTDGDITQVIRICIWMNAKRVECVSSNGGTIEFRPFELTHERPDSFERIADELQEWSETVNVADNLEIFDGVAEFADRIRKLAKK